MYVLRLLPPQPHQRQTVQPAGPRNNTSRHRIRNKKWQKVQIFLINRRSRRAFCCAFPAFLLPMAQKQSQKPRICSKWSPWSAGCGSCGARWCFVRWLQFSQNLEELTHGVRPGHARATVSAHFCRVSAHFVFTSGQMYDMLWADKLVSIQ